MELTGDWHLLIKSDRISSSFSNYSIFLFPESCNEHLVTTTCIGLSLIDSLSLLEVALGNFHDLRLPMMAKHHSGIKKDAGVN